jgi:hypothetical protein
MISLGTSRAQRRVGEAVDRLELVEPRERLGGGGDEVVARVDDGHPGPALGDPAGRMGDERQPQRTADDGRDRLHERDLVVAEAMGGPGAVEMQQAPAAAARVERGPQLGVGVHQRAQLPPAGAALRPAAGRGVQVGDLARGAGEVGELVEVRYLELVLPERRAHAVRHPVHDAGPEAEQRVRVGRGHDEGLDGHRAAQLVGDALDQGLGRQLLVGEGFDPARGARQVPSRCRCHGARRYARRAFAAMRLPAPPTVGRPAFACGAALISLR